MVAVEGPGGGTRCRWRVNGEESRKKGRKKRKGPDMQKYNR